MTTSRDTFNKQCYTFVNKCNKLLDKWDLSIVDSNGVKQLQTNDLAFENLDGLELMLTKTEVRDPIIETNIWTYEYTVIYSHSYEVPVMYFTVSNQDGSPVRLEAAIPESALVTDNHHSLQTVANQVEHPILFRPFYMIHPCRTRDLMDLHESHSADNYFITWLSSVATLLDLKLPPELGQSLKLS